MMMMMMMMIIITMCDYKYRAMQKDVNFKNFVRNVLFDKTTGVL